ncbi:MAG TPA: GNAT family N-acetyltransferase [Candidatus Eisenbacteria bacterium]|nr:GNAT family N-acetyltransferase [Candidatus Eisenbacteria bacterium]
MALHPVVTVPEGLRTQRLLLRPLLAADAERDYAAVMSDPAALRRWSQSDWPSDDFTLAENLADLERHEREHKDGIAFTFTVLSPDGGRCLGCVYLTPVFKEAANLCRGAAYPVQLGFWVRSSEVASDLDRHLFEALRRWLRNDWAFDCVTLAISVKDERQEQVVRDAGLGPGASLLLGDGRECWAFVEWLQNTRPTT